MHRTLSSIVQKGSSSIKLSDVSSSGKYPVFGASGLVGYLDTFQTDVESVAVIKDGAGVGRSQIIPPNSSVLGTIQLIRPNAGIKASYIKYLIDSMHLGNAYTGATIPHIYFKDYGEKRIPDHSEFERRNICKVLDGIVNETKLLQRQINFLDEQVKSLFNELFSDCPQIKNVEAIATLITDGEHQTPQRSETGYLLLSARNIGNHELLLNDVDHIPESEYQRISRRVVPQEGDVLISCSGTIGRVCAVPANLQFQMVRSAALIRPAKTVRTKYLEYALTSEELQCQIQESAVAVAQANLFQGKIKKLRIRVPSLADQDEFIERLNQIDKLRFMYPTLPLDGPKMHDNALERQQL